MTWEGLKPQYLTCFFSALWTFTTYPERAVPNFLLSFSWQKAVPNSLFWFTGFLEFSGAPEVKTLLGWVPMMQRVFFTPALSSFPQPRSSPCMRYTSHESIVIICNHMYSYVTWYAKPFQICLVSGQPALIPRIWQVGSKMREARFVSCSCAQGTECPAREETAEKLPAAFRFFPMPGKVPESEVCHVRHPCRE